MIILKIKIKSASGAKYEDCEHLDDYFNLSRENTEFDKMIQKHMDLSHFKEFDSVKVIANFGDI